MTSPSLTLTSLVFLALVPLTSGSLVRKNVDSLTENEVLALRSYLRQLEDDTSDSGFQKLVAEYHGEPSMCTDAEGHPVACCIHGMATFPQWHRLYVVQFEQALVQHGLANIGVPYWDWTEPLSELPHLVQDQIFRDPKGGLGQKNAWFAGDVRFGDVNTQTARAVDDRLFEHVAPGEKTHLFDLVLDALEQEDYCQFEVQYEVAHNHIHYLVGGRHLYSMSTLEYTSYDPIFFLHHSNVDRLFVIWQELQKKRGKPYDHADCSVELFRQNLEPFDRDSNPIELTRTFSHGKDLFSHMQLGYTYDDLTLNGLSVDQLYSLLEQRKARERAFAAFSLHGVGFSANVRVKVCEGDRDEDMELATRHHCEFAGDFFLLGGANEMPWQYHRPYYFDISDALRRLGQPLDGHYYVDAEVFSVNGTSLGNDVFSRPYGSYRPPQGYSDPLIAEGKSERTIVRKNVNVLTDEEVYALRQAMARFQNDTSVDGFQAVAEFHGLPAKCPHPDASVRYACCIHGMFTFPHWHRLFVVEVEDELKSRGLEIGMPYWDWTAPHATVPALAAEATYTDPHTGKTLHNPFYDAEVAFLGERTSREVQVDDLSKDPPFGDHTPLFDAMLLAFEQTDYCDFEVQMEVVHNAIHFLVGGFAPYSMTTLHYSAFDPIFFLHHSSVDRLWAIWQQLQMLRGLPYKAHCASSMTHELLKPFGFPPPWSNDPKTFDNARPNNIYDYEAVLDYTYDTLQFGGMSVEQLHHYLEERQTRDRTFIGIQLFGIGTSAWAKVTITPRGGEPYHVGNLAILGGELEMPWRFDRLFKLEITEALTALGLNYDDDFEVHVDITDSNGNKLSENTYSHDTILHEPAHVHHLDGTMEKEEHVRSDILSLTREQVQNFRDAMQSLQEDTSINGYSHIAAFHGQPNWCPSPDAENKLACCAHGMAIFPHWHRLLTVQLENALHANGFHDGLPYWDWTLPMTELPVVLAEENYQHPQTGQSTPNPLHHSMVDGQKTSRNLRTAELFESTDFGKLTDMADKVMFAFEQTDFCDFEVQFEVVHNYIHILIGGNEMYSMASLRYTAYDPIFFLHHSMTDRIWAMWQALQKYRGLPYNSANCAIASLREPMQPFALTSLVNPDHVTRDHSVPFDAFDYRHSFNYRYDNFQFNGLSIPQIQREVILRQSDDRVFAGFMLHGVGKSALVVFEICQPSGSCTKAGEFYLLGDEYEIPWRYDRLYKHEITKQLKDLNLDPKDNYDIHYVVYDLDGTSLGDDAFGNTTIVFTHGHLDSKRYMEEVKSSPHVRLNLNDLAPADVESLRQALRNMEEDGTFKTIAEFHGYPGLCQLDGGPIACCIHGAATFPHWHRLYVQQLEEALLSHGSAVAMPYWDWTTPITELPALFHDATYFDSRTLTKEPNPFFRGKISNMDEYTSRDPLPDMFNTDYFLDSMLLALEQTSFCDFEIQFEIVHNAMHSWLGGRGKYSMSSLDFTSFDPVFFLYHSNTDRIWAIWQALQMHRGLYFEESDCALNLMRKPLKPFDDTSAAYMSLRYNLPVDVFDYSGHLNYHYDTLKLNGWTIPQLEEVLKQQRSRDRLFAGFLLNNIGSSAEVEINVCVPTGDGSHNCNHPAGKFCLLGGDYEMPYTFDRLYKHDISDAVRKLGLRLDSAADFDLQIKVKAANGSYISPNVLPRPSILFQPGENKHQDEQGHSHRRLVRKDVTTLSPAERRSLILAMKSLQQDDSADGFQSIAAFHALPPLCPNPEANERFACCIHGMATFPQWHRVYTVQFEDALRRHGSLVGVPYFDTLHAIDQLPVFMTEATWHDPLYDIDTPNPWAGADIEFEGAKVVRDVQMDKLSKKGEHGYDTWAWKQFMLALEQENYCDFEIQFEIAHNAMHLWLGSGEKYSMGHLHYASYDPAFILHHSSMDRIFALWQELQKYRGHDPNEVNCAMELMREPLKPFSFGTPYNLNPTTKEYSRPEDSFDYQAHFNYEYDKLEFQGLDVARIQNYINEGKEKDRVFAGFLLHGFGSSARVDFSVCTGDGDDCLVAGEFHILGGSAEMPWTFDRLYKYEITDVLKQKGLDVRDHFHLEATVTATNGTVLRGLMPEPSIIYDPKSRDLDRREVAPNRVRRDLRHLSDRDVMSLKAAMHDLQQDKGTDGYQTLASFHGAPAMCPTPEAAEHACCIHGMPTFPHWHRLYTVEMENALIRHGSGVALPYWDWTLPLDELPNLFTSETYYDAWRDEVMHNPFSRGYVSSVNGYTVRDIQPELYKRCKSGKHSMLYYEVLLALEQTDYCDFEVQFEVTHNAIHYLVGGRQMYSLSSVEYSSYDPIFFVHHTFVDKIWAVWQELQKRRGLPHDRADCAVNYMQETLHPFDWEQFNRDVRTRAHSVPQTVFDYEDLGYHYDDMTLGGMTLEQLEDIIHVRQSRPRVFAGFSLHGISTSADVEFHICKAEGECTRAGGFFILGGPLEMPWTFDRLFKYDITDVLKEAHISPEDVFNAQAPFTIKVDIHAVNGSALPASTLPAPTVIFDPAHGAAADQASYSVAGVGVRKDINSLTDAETKSLRDSLQALMDGQAPMSYQQFAEWHGYPGLCQLDGKIVACCHHGMASFPQWHRLYVRVLEMMMSHLGARVGIPYWDWTEAFTELPALLTEEKNNPFHHGVIDSVHQTTTRAPRPQLFRDPEHGHESFFYRQVMLAFEQRDYCDFEVQFEVIHNAIHSWVGGTSPYGMSTLEYTSFDPLFFIHHSNVDRQFAIWQALQKHRGLDYNTANCNIQELRMTMEPFDSEKNPFLIIREHARAIDAFNYDQFNYQYDNLNFHGLTIAELDDLLEKNKEEDHVYANFLLHGLFTSADVEFELCDADDHCQFAGTFALLGGPLEMPWRFDRLFKYDVTSVFRQMRLRPDSVYHFKVHITAVNGTELDSSLLDAPSVSFVPGTRHGNEVHQDAEPTDNDDLTRYEVSEMSLEQVSNLRNALYKLQNDHGPNGFEAIASFHGSPGLCPQEGQDKISCCRHGMPAFPHWHRLLTVQFERALKEKGAVVGVPYWDWTRPVNALPSLFTDPYGGNPFRSYYISFVRQNVVRDVQSDLLTHSAEADQQSLFHQALHMLEETSYCDFEVQYEMLHNAVHGLVGGRETYSMSTLDYSAFDPLFMVHHSSIDRLWQIWQTLQKLRHKPFNFARCAGRDLFKPLEPFSYDTVNTDEVTRANSQPVEVFDTAKFNYHFDNLKLNGHSLKELQELMDVMKASPRVFAGFILHGVGTSANVYVDVVAPNGTKVPAGHFFILGGEDEMPWAYERPYKLEITEAVRKAGLSIGDTIPISTTVTSYDGTPLDVDIHAPLIIERPANADYDVVVLQYSKEYKPPYKVTVRRGTRLRLHIGNSGMQFTAVRELGSFTSSRLCITPPGATNSYAVEVEHILEPGTYFFVNPNKQSCLGGCRFIFSVDDE